MRRKMTGRTLKKDIEEEILTVNGSRLHLESQQATNQHTALVQWRLPSSFPLGIALLLPLIP